MKISLKAAIYSSIVFPGAGYFIVKNKHRAILSLMICLTCLSLLAYEANHKAHIIAEKIILGSIPLDPTIIKEQIVSTPGILKPELLTAISFTIVTVWIFSIIDSYRLGKKLEKSH